MRAEASAVHRDDAAGLEGSLVGGGSDRAGACEWHGRTDVQRRRCARSAVFKNRRNLISTGGPAEPSASSSMMIRAGMVLLIGSSALPLA